MKKIENKNETSKIKIIIVKKQKMLKKKMKKIQKF